MFVQVVACLESSFEQELDALLYSVLDKVSAV